ncbi:MULTISPECIES: hypothetical protein [Gimesia]|jgi:hypothetical protein|uniref:Uncharacterized protein n=2 Tax=Gimesia TaxID=1649453 RepID=A0A6I6AIW4_9PLAN|nr:MULTISPECIES: hypothetical protein [Gimesia]MBP69272.1 hypothetical protein [Haliea sp.]QDT21982.1 hypothetical protein HG66A1_37880 [Gimesia chilikensis]QGQ26218.1 hypothetical protein F1728_27620 [Gimesia benthica]|tara:strand:- start:757 stop:1365 length:609 start_codon:yes stop_codon:yes gene_type:complete
MTKTGTLIQTILVFTKTRRRILVSVLILTFIFAITQVPFAMSLDTAPSTGSVDVRYFQKKLELAKHDLQRAVKANQRVPNLTSKLMMIRLQNQVDYTETLLKRAMTKTDHDLHTTHLQNVKNDVTLAEQQLVWAKDVNQRQAGLVSDDEVQRLQLSVDLARLALERAKQPKIKADPLHHLQWQIDRLRSELLNLQVEFERVR